MAQCLSTLVAPAGLEFNFQHSTSRGSLPVSEDFIHSSDLQRHLHAHGTYRLRPTYTHIKVFQNKTKPDVQAVEIANWR